MIGKKRATYIKEEKPRNLSVKMYRFSVAVISSCCLFAGYLALPQEGAKPPTDQARLVVRKRNIFFAKTLKVK